MLYLLTNPFTTQLGIYEISIKQVAFQMGYSIDAVKVLIDRFENKYGVIFFVKDKDSDLIGEVAIKNFLRHSIIKGGAPVHDCLIKEMKKVKNRDLISKVFSHIKDNENLNATVKNLISEYKKENGALYYSNSSIYKNNENNNDIDNENENDNDVSLHDSLTIRSTPPSPEEIIDIYNQLCPSLSKMIVLSDPIKEDLDESLKIYSLDDFTMLFKKAERSNFLKGENEKKWAASFDWLIKKDNIAKVLNGKFDNKGTTTYAGYSLELFEQMLNEKN